MTGKSSLLQSLFRLRPTTIGGPGRGPEVDGGPPRFFQGTDRTARVALDNIENLPDGRGGPQGRIRRRAGPAGHAWPAAAGMSLSPHVPRHPAGTAGNHSPHPHGGPGSAGFQADGAQAPPPAGGLPGYFQAPALEMADLDGWIETFLEEDIGAFLRVKQYSPRQVPADGLDAERHRPSRRPLTPSTAR